MKRKMGFARSTPNKVFHKDKTMGGMGMNEITEIKTFRRIMLFIKEQRKQSEMGEALFAALTCFEREIGIKISRVIRKNTSIDCVQNGWWKDAAAHCIHDKMRTDAFEETQMEDAEALMEFISGKQAASLEKRAMNFLIMKIL